MSQAKPSPIIKLSLLGMLALALMQGYKATEWVNNYIAGLPIEGQAPASDGKPPAAKAPAIEKTLAPLLVQSNQKRRDLGSVERPGFADSESMQALFGLKPGNDSVGRPLDGRQGSTQGRAGRSDTPAPVDPAASEPAIPVIDYFLMLPQYASVQAVTDKGAVINGRLVEVGEQVKSLGYTSPRDSKLVFPRLAAVHRDSVVLEEPVGSRYLTLKLAK